MARKTIFTVKRGYTKLADFEQLEQATKFFTTLVQAPQKSLVKVEGKTSSAYYWKIGTEYTISSEELDVYNTEKEAKFQVFGEEEKDNV